MVWLVCFIFICYLWPLTSVEMIKNIKKKGRVWHLPDSLHSSLLTNISFHLSKFCLYINICVVMITYAVLQYGSQRVPTAASPSNTNSSSSSNTGSQSGTLSTSLSNNMGPGPAGEQLSKTNLYIRGLNQNTTDKDLVQMCSMWVYNHRLYIWHTAAVVTILPSTQGSQTVGKVIIDISWKWWSDAERCIMLQTDPLHLVTSFSETTSKVSIKITAYMYLIRHH